MPQRDLEARRAYRRKYDLERYYARRREAEVFLGGNCAGCGETHNLQFDHIDPSTKSFNVSRMWGLSKDKFWSELKKCQLLCEECHKTKSNEEQRTDKHGTWAMHKRGCRCNECREFVNAYSREYKRRKRAGR